MFVYNDAEHDARVWREATTLAGQGMRVKIFGLMAPGLPASVSRDGVELIRVPAGGVAIPGSGRAHTGRGLGTRKAVWLARYLWAHGGWRRRAAHRAGEFAVGGRLIWHGHDLTGLPAAALAQRLYGGRLVYDSHELFVEADTVSRLPSFARRLIADYERRLIGRADGVITVNDLIASELVERYRIATPTVVMNCPPLGEPPGERIHSPLRRALHLGSRPVVLYHGGITPPRVVSALQAMDHLAPNVALVLLGQGWDAGWLDQWRRDPTYRQRLYFHPAVPLEALAEWVTGADVGIMTFLPTHKNHRLVTPNKLFECINVGVPVTASDFPAMRSIVESRDLGELCDPSDPRSVAAAINALLSEDPELRLERRRRCRRAAEERYSWERESKHLIELYGRLAARDSMVATA